MIAEKLESNGSINKSGRFGGPKSTSPTFRPPHYIDTVKVKLSDPNSIEISPNRLSSATNKGFDHYH